MTKPADEHSLSALRRAGPSNPIKLGLVVACHKAVVYPKPFAPSNGAPANGQRQNRRKDLPSSTDRLGPNCQADVGAAGNRSR